MNSFILRAFGDPDPESDYRLLHALSNYQVPQDPVGNLEWLENRRTYDESAGHRRHYIAVDAASGEPAGYASVEQERGGRDCYRMFLVFDPSRWGFSELGEFMYGRILDDARRMGAARIAFTEYSNDMPFFDFLTEKGFVETGRTLFNGFEVSRVELALSPNLS